jgi:hypothetical protein
MEARGNIVIVDHGYKIDRDGAPDRRGVEGPVRVRDTTGGGASRDTRCIVV